MKFSILIVLLLSSCSTGKLTVIANVSESLIEISAAEILPGSDLIWTIEDAGNKNNLYAIDIKGNLIKDIDISNATNKDWEELTSDSLGNIYIGDFGNNHKKRKLFTIYKVSHPEKVETSTTAERINFSLPKGLKSKDFEAFFIYNNAFYIFSKEEKNAVVIKVPITIGDHVAELVSEFTLEGKDNRITAADISDDKKTILLLNHNKIWVLTDFKTDSFFDGKITAIPLDHDSQKEGICFKSKKVIYITDERKKNEGGNLYEFKLDKAN